MTCFVGQSYTGEMYICNQVTKSYSDKGVTKGML